MADTVAKDILSGEGWNHLSSAEEIVTETETDDRTAQEMMIRRAGVATQSREGKGRGGTGTSDGMRIVGRKGLTITTAPGKMMASVTVDGITDGAMDPGTVTWKKKKNMQAIGKDVAERLAVPIRAARHEGGDPTLGLAIGQIARRTTYEASPNPNRTSLHRLDLEKAAANGRPRPLKIQTHLPNEKDWIHAL
jgi:hypothetical protein